MDYFNYQVLYVMNVTDVDDKIIKRARGGHLFRQYVSEGRGQDQLLQDISAAMKVLTDQC